MSRSPLTEDHKAKVSLALKGRTLSEEHRANLSKAALGKVMSKEARAKMSAAKKGCAPAIKGRGLRNFWNRVDKKENGCWEWTGSKTDGYGMLKVNGKGRGAHCVSYELLIGPIPACLELDHLCRNRACVNPAHLEPVTTKVNILRGNGKSAQYARRTHCDNGHPLTEENIYPNFAEKGVRICKQCFTPSRKRRVV